MSVQDSNISPSSPSGTKEIRQTLVLEPVSLNPDEVDDAAEPTPPPAEAEQKAFTIDQLLAWFRNSSTEVFSIQTAENEWTKRNKHQLSKLFFSWAAGFIPSGEKLAQPIFIKKKKINPNTGKPLLQITVEGGKRQTNPMFEVQEEKDKFKDIVANVKDQTLAKRTVLLTRLLRGWEFPKEDEAEPIDPEKLTTPDPEILIVRSLRVYEDMDFLYEDDQDKFIYRFIGGTPDFPALSLKEYTFLINDYLRKLPEEIAKVLRSQLVLCIRERQQEFNDERLSAIEAELKNRFLSLQEPKPEKTGLGRMIPWRGDQNEKLPSSGLMHEVAISLEEGITYQTPASVPVVSHFDLHRVGSTMPQQEIDRLGKLWQIYQDVKALKADRKKQAELQTRAEEFKTRVNALLGRYYVNVKLPDAKQIWLKDRKEFKKIKGLLDDLKNTLVVKAEDMKDIDELFTLFDGVPNSLHSLEKRLLHPFGSDNQEYYAVVVEAETWLLEQEKKIQGLLKQHGLAEADQQKLMKKYPNLTLEIIEMGIGHAYERAGSLKDLQQDIENMLNQYGRTDALPLWSAVIPVLATSESKSKRD